MDQKEPILKVSGYLLNRIDFDINLLYKVRYSQFIGCHAQEINGGALFINSSNSKTFLYGSYFFDCSSKKRGGSFCIYSKNILAGKTCSESCFLLDRILYYNGNGGNLDAIDIEHNLSIISECSPDGKNGNCCFALRNSEKAVASDINATNSDYEGYLFSYCKSESSVKFSNFDGIDTSSVYIFFCESLKLKNCNIINSLQNGFIFQESNSITLIEFVFQNNNVDIFWQKSSSYPGASIQCRGCITDKSSFGEGTPDENCETGITNPLLNNIIRIGNCIQDPLQKESNFFVFRKLRKILNTIIINFE